VNFEFINIDELIWVLRTKKAEEKLPKILGKISLYSKVKNIF